MKKQSFIEKVMKNFKRGIAFNNLINEIKILTDISPENLINKALEDKVIYKENNKYFLT